MFLVLTCAHFHHIPPPPLPLPAKLQTLRWPPEEGWLPNLPKAQAHEEEEEEARAALRRGAEASHTTWPPEEGWLPNLSKPQAHEEVSASSGCIHMHRLRVSCTAWPGVLRGITWVVNTLRRAPTPHSAHVTLLKPPLQLQVQHTHLLR